MLGKLSVSDNTLAKSGILEVNNRDNTNTGTGCDEA